MNVFQAIILGIVQGLTEFLPVSSSGHLQVFQNLLGITEPMMTFDIVLHLGTLIPILIIFRKDIIDLILHPFQKFTLMLIIGTIPAIFVGLFLGDMVDFLFNNSVLLPIGFIITGILLIVADNMKGGTKKEKDITVVDALVVGCMQAVAIAPAISRSGSTITGALLVKMDRETATKFSFLLSIPAILGAAVLEIAKVATGRGEVGNIEFAPLFFGFIAALLTGYLAITFMIKLIQKSNLKIFSYYVFFLAGALFIFNIII